MIAAAWVAVALLTGLLTGIALGRWLADHETLSHARTKQRHRMRGEWFIILPEERYHDLAVGYWANRQRTRSRPS